LPNLQQPQKDTLRKPTVLPIMRVIASSSFLGFGNNTMHATYHKISTFDVVKLEQKLLKSIIQKNL
jgi:hypothetical protein